MRRLRAHPTGSRPPRIALGLTLVVATIFVVSSWGVAESAPAARPLKAISEFDSHIDHIVFLMQENHAYDSLFGTYCQASGSYCPDVASGIPPGTCVPKNPAKPASACIRPYNLTVQNLSPADMPHEWASSHEAYANGTMGGFYYAEDRRLTAFGHYNGTTAPVYWDLAEEYGLADDFFSSTLSYSLPNHWYEVASTAPADSYRKQISTVPITQKHLYLNESNATPSIEEELLRSNVSWTWYDWALSSYSSAIQAPTGKVPGLAYGYWDPLAAQNLSYTPSAISHFEPRANFFGAAANGTLPEVSWIIPAAQNSDHPPFNLTSGQDWVADVVDALEQSPEWNSTVLFVSWDEYGGFWDNVAPLTISPDGDGFRVPLLAISPWIGQGYVDHQQMDFSSILHLIEERFGLKCLGPADCNATLPLSLFNFALKRPRPPIQFFHYGIASYPMPLETSGKLPYYGVREGAAPVTYVAPDPIPASIADDPNIDWS